MSLAKEISNVESRMARHQYGAVVDGVMRLLQRLEMRDAYFGAGPLPTAGMEAEATRLAAVITSLLANPAFKPGMREWRGFLMFKRVISQIFEISGYRGTGHLRRLITEAAHREKRGPTAAEAARLLMGISINDADKPVLALLRSLPPEQGLVCVLAFLSEYLTWSRELESARTQLLQSAWLPERAALASGEWTLLASAWMACSYADAPHKHDIKERLNRVVRNWLLSRGVREAGERDAAAAAAVERPTLLVVAEIFSPGHAMDRCYRVALRSLRKYFRTVLMTASPLKSEISDTLFDEVDGTSFDASQPEKFLEKARSHQPAIAYFPSVGMRIAGIACANVRLAPIQIFSLGHPATTRSPCMDYAIVVDGVQGDPAPFSETLLVRESAPHYIGTGDPAVAPAIRKEADPVRLAVPAWIRKITPRFLNTCREIRSRSKRPVEFWFFPNLAGALFQAAHRRLSDALPARVFPVTPYNVYIGNLNACDIHLSTFPFGSTNGIVDSAGQGLPMVNMIGDEPHTRMDSMLLRRLGQPEWLTVSSPGEYIDAVVKLVENDALRVEISEQLLNSNPASHFLLPEDAVTDDFADMFLAVYRHHESIRAAGRKLWTHEQLMNLDAEQGQASNVG